MKSSSTGGDQVMTKCPICKRMGDFGLMEDGHKNLMCKWCYMEIYGGGYTITTTNPNVTITNDSFPKLKDNG